MTKARALNSKPNLQPLSENEKYALYEAAVQDPKDDTHTIAKIVRTLRGREPLSLREDFCGTFAFSSAWVRRSPRHRALGIDLDPAPLNYGLKHHFSQLKPHQQKRIRLVQQNVLVPTVPGVDLIAALNFSYWIFKLRGMLKRYFRACLQSLNRRGCLVLDLCGGPEMLRKNLDRSKFRLNRKQYTYLWEQKSYDPTTNESQFAIHFKTPSGRIARDVFTYDWRIWTVPEIRDLLLEVGFREVHVFYEDDQGRFREAPPPEEDVVFIAYIVGMA